MPQVRRDKVANLWNAKLFGGSVGKSCCLRHALERAGRQALHWRFPIEMLRLFHRRLLD